MTTESDPLEFSEISSQNEAALEELVSAIAFSQGTDTLALLLVRCNYAQLRERMVAQLLRQLETETLQGEVHVLRLEASEHNLYAHIQDTTLHGSPGAVLVLVTEESDSLETLLVEINKRREEFRRDFPFPVVLWLTDNGYHQLSQFASDFESIAGGETITFRLSEDDLAQRLREAADQMFAALLTLDCPDSFNQRLAKLELDYLAQEEVEIALADLQSYSYPITPELQASIQFAQGLNVTNEKAITLFQQSAAYWQTQPDLPAAQLRRGLALFYLGQARYFVASNAKYQQAQNQQRQWAEVLPPLKECLAVFERANRPDLVAICIRRLQQTLHRLKRWDELEAVVQQALPLHRTYGNIERLAQDYGFQADIALHRQQWQAALALAQQALNILEQQPEPTWWRMFYLKLRAEAEQALGNQAGAIEHLQMAQSMGVMDRPQLYSNVLSQLQQCLREQDQYLEAFEVKQERLAVERQYGLRAFIGAGRLRSQRTEQWTTVRSGRETLETIAPEIAASGRYHDLKELLHRIAGTSYKLIVIHGASGVGKSSLIQGGLIPALQARALENRDNIPVLVRRYTHWQKELTTALTTALTTQNSKSKIQYPKSKIQNRSTERSRRSPKSLSALLTTLSHCEERTLRPVLIFDQFEEFFFANPDPIARRKFFQFVADCLELQPSALKVVLSLREDYLHYLLEAKQLVKRSELAEGSMARSQLEDILGKQTLYAIGNFSLTETKAVIQRLTVGSKVYLEPELVDMLVDDLAGRRGEVRPIEMQIVGAQLQTERIQNLKHYRQLGAEPKEMLVQHYLEDVVIDCGPKNRQLTELVMFLLTDERGTRPLKTKSELARDIWAEMMPLAETHDSRKKQLGQSDATITFSLNRSNLLIHLDAILYILCGGGIIVYLPDESGQRYQLVHDYIAEVVRQRYIPQLDTLIRELRKERSKRQKSEIAQSLLKQRLRDAGRANIIIARSQEKAKIDRFNPEIIVKEVFTNKLFISRISIFLFLVFLCRSLGIFQSIELLVLDQMFQLRPTEPPDPRIIIVNLDEDDIRDLPVYPVPDHMMAQILTNIKAHHPRVIGLDIYQNLSYSPGQDELEAVFRETPNLVGIEKIGDRDSFSVVAHPLLEQRDQVGFNNRDVVN